MVNNIRYFMFGAIFSVSIAAPNPGKWQRRQEDGTDYHDSTDAGYGDRGAKTDGENFFQEIYMLQSSPKEIEFGHVCENPHEWEQRYEKKDFDRNRHQGKSKMYDFGFRRGNEEYLMERYEKADPRNGLFKTQVRWADRSGGHGEHYWDYNHAGPSDVKEVETKDHKQHHKRQLTKEESKEEEEEKTTLSTEARDFLESFHREIGGVFDLERNRKLFSEPRRDPFRQISNNVRYFFDLPETKNSDN